MSIVELFKKADGQFNQEAYAKIVKAKKRYLKDLYAGLDDKDPLIREGCVAALGEIGGLESLPILIEHSADTNWHVRWDIKNSLNMLLGVFPADVIDSLTGCYRLKQRLKFKRKLDEFFHELFPVNSVKVYRRGYDLIKMGKTDVGIALVLKGLGKRDVDLDKIRRKLADMLKAKGWAEEANEIINYSDASSGVLRTLPLQITPQAAGNSTRRRD